MNELNTLAQRLRYAMEVLPPKKIKGVDLARAVGVKPPSVSDWLSGKSKTMEGENLLRAATHLNVNPIWLATGKGEVNPESLTSQELIISPQGPSQFSRSPSLERLIIKLELLYQSQSLTEEEIKLLQQTVDVLSKNKHANSDQFNNK